MGVGETEDKTHGEVVIGLGGRDSLNHERDMKNITTEHILFDVCQTC